MNKVPTASFTEFIQFFPPIKPPFSLLPDINQIPSDSTPLPGILLDSYILPFEGEEVDEYTEYIPYGRIEGTRDFHAIIYWKAGVMQYEFVLATFSLSGEPISHAIIGGMRADESGILHSVAIINEDLSIIIAEGVAREDDQPADPDTNTYQMTIESTGYITYDINEEDES